MSVTPPVLEATGISKHFGNVTALRDASLRLEAGKVTALVGDNGAGKSTLVKVISGVLQPDSGNLLVNGQKVELKDPRAARSLGVHTLFQDLALVADLSTVENMFLGTELHVRFGSVRLPWLDRKGMRREAERALENLHVTTLVDVRGRVEGLSGGQRQSVAIARAVRSQASLVILDEPTAALGVAQAAEVLRLVERLRSVGTSVLLISHNMAEVFSVADVIAVLRLGEVIAQFDTAKTTHEEVVAAIVGAMPTLLDSEESPV